MGKLPAFQFYPGDWMKDPKVSKLKEASRGIWFDLICAMHEDHQSGEVSGTVEQLARISRSNIENFNSAIQDLIATKAADVTFCNGNVTIVNRRMNRAFKDKQASALRVKRHRLKQESNENVTIPSSSSSSTSVNIDRDKDEKWNHKPAAFFELLEQEINTTHEFIFRIKQTDLSIPRLKDFWAAFQTNYFTGENFYDSRSKCLKHFRDWLKFQDLGENSKLKISDAKYGNSKRSTAKADKQNAAFEQLLKPFNGNYDINGSGEQSA